MIEFGSDYHRCDAAYQGQNNLGTILHTPQYYASGRMALIAIAQHEGWNRLWIPAYFCHEIIDTWRHYINVCLYDDYPLEENDEDVVRGLPYAQGDALLRMNFFGLRSKRTNAGISVPVVEDHSHALCSNWALNSDADWCIASLRKSLPLAFGGVLWSPKGLDLPVAPTHNARCNQLAAERYQAMEMKAQYLLDEEGNKNLFRAKYIASEQGLDCITSVAAIDSESALILRELDIMQWNNQKKHNWQIACDRLQKLEIIGRRGQGLMPFSIILSMSDNESRNKIRTYLIEHAIFPATLWNIPEEVPYTRCKNFSKRMLSIHCDARYTEQDITKMCEIINQYDANY